MVDGFASISTSLESLVVLYTAFYSCISIFLFPMVPAGEHSHASKTLLKSAQSLLWLMVTHCSSLSHVLGSLLPPLVGVEGSLLVCVPLGDIVVCVGGM